MADRNQYDVIIIGAGKQAGDHQLLVIERTTPAARTSSRSTKWIPGRPRALESGQFRLVREGLREQQRSSTLSAWQMAGGAPRVPVIVSIWR